MSIARLVILLLAATLTLALACGGDEQKGVGASSDQFGESSAIPDEFPEDVPIYPDARVVTTERAAGGGRGIVLQLQTGDDLEEVTHFYRTKLVQQGWRLIPALDLEDTHVLQIEKGDRRGGVQLAKWEGETSIIIFLGVGR